MAAACTTGYRAASRLPTDAMSSIPLAHGAPVFRPEPRVRAAEWRAVLVSSAYFFSVLSAYYMVRPVREQLSAAVGSTQLPLFYAATFVVTLCLTPVFAWLVSRFPRRVVVPAVYAFFIACLLAFVPLFAREDLLGPRALGALFFVWVSVFNLFVVSVFWSFMNDVWSEPQARRLFPVIAVGGTLGALAGPVLTRTLVGIIGVAPLLVVSAALLSVGMGCVVWMGRWAREHGERRHQSGHEAPIGGGMLDGLRQILSDPVMRAMALLLLLADGIGTVNYALVADYSGATFESSVERTAFAANVDIASNVLTIVLQLLVTRWLLPLRGPGALIAVWGVVGVVTLTLVAMVDDPHAPLAFGLPAVALALIVGRGMAYGMAEPARHAFFSRLPRSERYKGQNAIDTAVWRFGDLIISQGMNILRAGGLAIGGFAALSACAAAGASGVGWWLSRHVPKRPDAVN